MRGCRVLNIAKVLESRFDTLDTQYDDFSDRWQSAPSQAVVTECRNLPMTAILRCTMRLLLNHFESLITRHEPNNSAVQQSLLVSSPNSLVRTIKPIRGLWPTHKACRDKTSAATLRDDGGTKLFAKAGSQYPRLPFDLCPKIWNSLGLHKERPRSLRAGTLWHASITMHSGCAATGDLRFVRSR